MPGYLFAFLPRPTSTIFTVVSATFSNGVSTVTFTPAANDTYPIGTQMWEVAQNTPTIVAEGDGIEFDEEGSLTIISLNPATATYSWWYFNWFTNHWSICARCKF